VDSSSAASASQLAAFESIGADPGPAYISPLLTSGGSNPKSMPVYLSFSDCFSIQRDDLSAGLPPRIRI
jgi:hypothetical protein